MIAQTPPSLSTTNARQVWDGAFVDDRYLERYVREIRTQADNVRAAAGSLNHALNTASENGISQAF